MRVLITGAAGFLGRKLTDALLRRPVLRAHGGELIGEVEQYEDLYRLCYMRGPAGIIVSLAEELF